MSRWIDTLDFSDAQNHLLSMRLPSALMMLSEAYAVEMRTGKRAEFLVNSASALIVLERRELRDQHAKIEDQRYPSLVQAIIAVGHGIAFPLTVSFNLRCAEAHLRTLWKLYQ